MFHIHAHQCHLRGTLLYVRWVNKQYERSRWMVVFAMIGLVMQMAFGFRAADDILGAVVNILIYTPCFSLIGMAIYNIETTRANRRKMNLVCGVINAATLLVFLVGISLHHSLYIKEGLYMMLALFCMSVAYSISMIVREMIRCKKMLETMAATDMLHCSSQNKIFYQLNINELSTLKNVTANDLETSYILFLSQLCNIQRTLCLRVQR